MEINVNEQIVAILKSIIDKLGESAFNDTGRFKDAIGDFLPSSGQEVRRTRKRLIEAIELGAYNRLKQAAAENAIRTECLRLVRLLNDEGIDAVVAEEIVQSLAALFVEEEVFTPTTTSPVSTTPQPPPSAGINKLMQDAVSAELKKTNTANSSRLHQLSKTSHNTKITPEVGSTIPFDGYDWRVLDMQNGKALLLSENIIEKRVYHSTSTGVTWERCDLRQYLNGAFYNQFSSQDKARIAKTCNVNNNNPWYGMEGGSTATDKIFLLSLDEVCCYFGDSTANLAKKGSTGSDYYIHDKNNSARIAKDATGAASWWWLRSPGYYSNYVARVNRNGRVFVFGDGVNDVYGGVRPALWLNL